MKTVVTILTALTALTALTVLALVTPAGAQTARSEAQVRQTVREFYAAFNSHGFDRAADFTTDDWNHVNPFGGRTRGRAEVLRELREVHSTFLKGVTDSVEQMDVRFATSDVAVATVTSRVSAFTTPDGVKHASEQQIRTFVLVNRNGRWLIMQDHNTIVTPLPNVGHRSPTPPGVREVDRVRPDGSGVQLADSSARNDAHPSFFPDEERSPAM